MKEITFRRLTDDDLPLLHMWLNDPDVVRWWEGDDVTWDGVVRDYGSASTDPTEHWLAVADGRPVGWIQCFAVADYAHESEVQHWWALGVDHEAAGIDYLVGDSRDRGQGLGSAMIRAFVAQVVFGMHPRWTQAAASPQAENRSSWRALERAGFRFVGVFEDAHGPCRLMVVDRVMREHSSRVVGASRPEDADPGTETRACSVGSEGATFVNTAVVAG